jgi:hypothetical protein
MIDPGRPSVINGYLPFVPKSPTTYKHLKTSRTKMKILV